MKRTWAMLGLLAVVAVGGAADRGAGRELAGAWIGTWEGEGSGKFELSFVTRADADLQGTITVGTSVGEYTVELAMLAFSGSKMAGRYPYPLASRGEIVIDGDFGADTARGTWKLVEKGSEEVAFAGTWSVARQ